VLNSVCILRAILVGMAAVATMNVGAGELAPASADASCCRIVELRQYTLHPGQRDVLINLFDREFLETQEAVGMAVIGQFRDLDQPDHFVWLRGFRNMEARVQGLTAFYGGPVWHAHSGAANATMIDSDNVLLLEPAAPGKGFKRLPARSLKGDIDGTSSGLIVVTLFYTRPNELTAFSDLFTRRSLPRLEQDGAQTVAQYITSDQSNNFPKLPIRIGEHIFAWIARFHSADAFEAYRARVEKDRQWQQTIWPSLRQQLFREPEVLRLSPTSRSRLLAQD
jgi:NIPSNAP